MSRKKPYFAVSNGIQIGIFETWEKCKQLTSGYPNSDFKSFRSFGEARQWLESRLRERGIEPPKDYGIIHFPEF